ncbi:MAG: hypothetical protein V3R90_07755, partial [Limibaculum sp.]
MFQIYRQSHSASEQPGSYEVEMSLTHEVGGETPPKRNRAANVSKAPPSAPKTRAQPVQFAPAPVKP